MDEGRVTVEMEAKFLRESLQKSQITTERMVTILGSLDRRLSALDSAMRPTQMNTDALGEACGNIDKVLSSANEILGRFYLSHEAEAIIQKGPRENLQAYLMAMDQLRNNLHFFDSKRASRNSERVTSHINSLLVNAVLKIEEEFGRLLSAYSQPVDGNSLFEIRSNHDESDAKSHITDKRVYKVPVLIPARNLSLLHDLVLQMVQAGTFRECIHVYRVSHGPVLERSLRFLGVDRKEDVQRLSQEALKSKIGTWIEVIEIAIKSLFVGEKQLCHQIFHDIDPLEDLCFGAAIESSVDMLLSFGFAVTKHEWPVESLFSLLDMHKVLQNLQPEIETLFEAKSCTKMRQWFLNLIRHLSKATRTVISSFKEKIIAEDSSINASDCSVHSMTSYVFNYAKLLGVDYRTTLAVIYDEQAEGGQPVGQTAASTVTMILNALVSNLESKSQRYSDPALGHLFLMNNINYIVKKIKTSSAEDLVGDDWVPRHRKIVQQNSIKYRRVALAPILQIIATHVVNSSSSSIGGAMSSGVSKSAVKERFKSFNTQFEEMIHKQSQWNVPDNELRESLRLSVAELLLPAYTHFTKVLGSTVERSKHQEKFWKYSTEDVEVMIECLFQGSSANRPQG